MVHFVNILLAAFIALGPTAAYVSPSASLTGSSASSFAIAPRVRDFRYSTTGSTTVPTASGMTMKFGAIRNFGKKIRSGSFSSSTTTSSSRIGMSDAAAAAEPEEEKKSFLSKVCRNWLWICRQSTNIRHK